MLQPLFQQVKTYIIQQIEGGIWEAKTKIPSENQIAKQFEVSRSTVIRAFRELTTEGYLLRVQGLGTFVAPLNPKLALLELRSIADEITKRGGIHRCVVLYSAEENATEKLAQEMELEEGAVVFRTILLHCSDNNPVQLADRYVNPAMGGDYLKQDFSKITPNEYLFKHGPLTEAEHTIEAIMPDKKTRDILKLPENEPCLAIHRRTWSHEIVASKVTLYHVGSTFRLGGRFRPKDRSQCEF